MDHEIIKLVKANKLANESNIYLVCVESLTPNIKLFGSGPLESN